MSKNKTVLESAREDVIALVNQTNERIRELGIHTNSINNVLSIIQNQFDQIRNVPEEKAREFQRAKEIRLDWIKHVQKIEADYKTANNINVGGGAAGVGVGVSVAALGPTAAMSLATTFGVASTGTAISSLSGAAATNAALAWLGGGTLAAGGGGMAGGSALLALAGPIGWSIAGVALVGSGLIYWMTHSMKSRLERVFLDVSDRDKRNYELAIVEVNERIKRIINETKELNDAIVKIGTFGLDYAKMTEEQQYNLGTYVNLMLSSSRLLVNPIMGLQPKFTEDDCNRFISSVDGMDKYSGNRELFTYLANLLYGIKTDETDRSLLAKSFGRNKEFCSQMGIDKSVMTVDLMNVVCEAIELVSTRRK